ncbi:DUF2393 domain-containing protein [Edaphobacter flagellatus]|uniref:DUF2393 domain-containing protein n=1 Tax=Edaphobacter flagellatus TaxID=1933044 RepID=UPI0021B371CC|nr:DUF2393 domain-containing protein [Edaphobacter flagellatus]
MSDFERKDEAVNRQAPVFAPETKQQGMPLSAWLVAGAVVVLVLAGLIVAGRRKGAEIKGIQPPAAYAASLPLSSLAMSESTSLSGGKSTFIDGKIKNTGSSTVTGVTVQVLFRNEEQMPPQVDTVPLALVRTREPYVDTQPVSAAPLAPGDEREFRLIFESIPANWNMQMPDIQVVRVDTK